jgi:tetratricopeptide (TPR) repeat protein
MEEADLVRNLTVERASNSSDFVDEAHRELERRGARLHDCIDRVSVRAGGAASGAMTIDQALAMVHDDVPRRSVAAFTNYLDATLVLQREGWGWVLHAYEDERYDGSWLADDTPTARQHVGAFLRLQPWMAAAGERHHLDNWKTLDSRADEAAMVQLSDRLSAAGVMHVVRPTLFAPAGDDSIALLVPRSERRRAEQVLREGDAAAATLRRAAEAQEAGGDRTAELAVYDELVEVDGESPAVHYNRGAVLLELDRPQEAATAFMEAAALGLSRQTPDLSMGRGSTAGSVLGLAGIFVRLAGRAAGSQPPPGWPEWFEDVDLQLAALLERLGPRADLLHSRASLARVRGDTTQALACYEQILRLDPDDQVARFQVQYLAAAGD